ncbi:11824_t:CDS:2 [Ambispora leptoticha]|uniref:11824_t:CDS:1 n=1 Tax=Ambispora leptoticha TaxID=144679 RepID=A0A9N8VPW2_9GLOM|nr:11824_t:CDS:2 [Ambispora leptoticha]
MGNIIPAPTIDKVSSILNRSHHESSTDNMNKTNNMDRNSSNNMNNVSGDLGKNLNNTTYSSSSELANIISKLNTSTLWSDNDLSMSDVRDSQPPQVKSINEEES